MRQSENHHFFYHNRVDNAQEIIKKFVDKYKMFIPDGNKTYWRCKLIGEKNGMLIFQFIDIEYEKPRGHIYTSSYLYVSVIQQDCGAVISYQVRWQIWKKIFYAASLLLSCAISIYLLWYASEVSSFAYIPLLMVVWFPFYIAISILREIKHDKTVLNVFSNLLKQNLYRKY